MNPEVKAKWVAALRSGEYTQSFNYLKASDGMCCLGVLCDLHAKAGLGAWKGNVYCASGLSDSKTLLPAVSEWAGLSFPQGAAVLINGDNDPLPVHNDLGCPFTKIADAIEAQL